MEIQHNSQRENLFRAILKLESIEDCKLFFDDVCTIKELDDMSQRLLIAEMLRSGYNYQEISKETGASTTTISRVNRCLNYGGGGYNSMLDRLSEGN